MNRWINRVALVTGASSGIGAAISKALAESGMKVVGAARNFEAIEKLSKEVKSDSGLIKPIKCDLTKEEDIEKTFKTITDEFGGVDVCVNNAGLTICSSLLDGRREDWRQMLDVNIVALCHCTKLAVASMEKRGVDDGQIINMSSLASHLPRTLTPFNFYGSTKHAVKAITEGYRGELREKKSSIRVACISPGMVYTEFYLRGFGGNAEILKSLPQFPPLVPEDVVQSIMYILSSPPNVEVNDILLRPTNQEI